MPVIHVTTKINAPVGVCFDLSRSIDLHKISTAHTNEEAVAGVTSGLINLHETVTWRATHFGVKKLLTTKITGFNAPYFFRDEQLSGAFKYFIHDHHFEESKGITTMKDVFDFKSPYGFLGVIFNKIILTNYMKALLVKRNSVIKQFAESDKWKKIITQI